MIRSRTGFTALLTLAFAAACAKDSPTGEVVAPTANVEASASSGAGSSDPNGWPGGRSIAILDDCDPRDPAWDPTGGCHLRRGNVTFAEFIAEANSPLAASVVGHQAWRNEPSYLVIRAGQTIQVRNQGGRTHTFTKVANFGSGRVPPLNNGLLPVPGPVEECGPHARDIAPGGLERISGLSEGNHRFMCCFHPWMRALVKVRGD